MRRIASLALAFSLTTWGAFAQPSGGNPAQAPTPAATSGNCAKWNGQNKLADAGAPCGSGGSVSITAGSGIVVSPSPLTGTGTVSADISGTPTAGNCVKWNTSTQFGDAGAACGSGGSSNITALTISSTTQTIAAGTCYKATTNIPALTTGTRINISGIIRRPASTGVAVAVVNSSSQGFATVWQGDNNAIVYRENTTTTQTSLQASGGTSPPFSPGWYRFSLSLTGDTTNGTNVLGNIDGIFGFSPRRDSTYDLSTGTWYVCIVAGSNTSADIGSVSMSQGAQP